MVMAPNRHPDADDRLALNAFNSFERGIAGAEQASCSPFAADATVKNTAVVGEIKQNHAASDGPFHDGVDDNGITGLNGRTHTQTVGSYRNRVACSQLLCSQSCSLRIKWILNDHLTDSCVSSNYVKE